MSKKCKCTFNDDLQKEFKFISNLMGWVKMELKLYVSNVTPIFLFHMEEGTTSINIYKVKNTRKLKKLWLLRETLALTSLHTVMTVKATKLQH